MTFAATGGPLAADTCTVTLRSAANGIVDEALGELLDGEYSGTFPTGSGTAGGDFVYSFAVDAPESLVVSLPDFTHGPSQAVQAPSQGSGGFGHLLERSYSYSTDQQVDHKEKIEKVLREKLSESFEIQSIQFHDPQGARPRCCGQVPALRRRRHRRHSGNRRSMPPAVGASELAVDRRRLGRIRAALPRWGIDMAAR